MTTLPVVPALASDWAKLKFGKFTHSHYALRRWIEQGHFRPAPEYINGQWFILSSAEYRDRYSNQIP